MIFISNNSLLPDLKAEEEAEKKQHKKSKKNIIAAFSYSNTIEETENAIKTFQYKFSSKRRWIAFIAAYSLILTAGVIALVFDPTNVVVYIACALCVFGLIHTITEKYRTRKHIIKALEKMSPEDYRCTIFEDRIEIETLIRHDEAPTSQKNENSPEENAEEMSEEAPEETEEKPDLKTELLKNTFRFDYDMLSFAENKESLLLIFNFRQIYCWPKRFLDEETQNAVREFLIEKLERDL